MADHPFLTRMKEAAYERQLEETQQRRQVEGIVLGKNPGRDRLGDVTKLGDDYVVEVIDRDGRSSWATVVGGTDSFWRWESQEIAVLALIARRYGDRDAAAVPYAARVLNIPERAS